MMNNKKLIPKLRFKEFNDEWQTVKLGDICETTSGGTPTKSYSKYYENGTIPWLGSGEIKHRYITKFKNKVTELALKESSAKIIKKGSLLIAMYGATVGEIGILTFDSATNQAICAIFENKNINQQYLYFYFLIIKQKLKTMSFGAGQQNISQAVIKDLQIPLPILEEQEKIADHLSSLDDLIDSQIKKLESFNEHKKGLLQNLFPTDTKKIPQYRFPKFKNTDDWQTVKLGDVLTYEQPTKYIVESTAYNDKYPIPVLTAGKSLILGNTNETNNIFNNTPVIIFDDFTTSSHYINFEFKIKSSAMKLLTIRSNDNLKFIHESMQLLKFTIKTHKRHWISLYQNLQILIPTLEEQEKIAHCLSSLDNLIDSQTNKIETLKQYKRGLLQNLIPSSQTI